MSLALRIHLLVYSAILFVGSLDTIPGGPF